MLGDCTFLWSLSHLQTTKQLWLEIFTCCRQTQYLKLCRYHHDISIVSFFISNSTLSHYKTRGCCLCTCIKCRRMRKVVLKIYGLHWHHNERDGISNYRRLDCLLNRLFGRRSKKTPKLRVTPLCEGNSPVIGEFTAQRVHNADDVIRIYV